MHWVLPGCLLWSSNIGVSVSKASASTAGIKPVLVWTDVVVLMVCPSFVCGHTYGMTEVKKCFYNFLIRFSRSIINYWKGTLGGFPKFLSKLPVKESSCLSFCFFHGSEVTCLDLLCNKMISYQDLKSAQSSYSLEIFNQIESLGIFCAVHLTTFIFFNFRGWYFRFTIGYVKYFLHLLRFQILIYLWRFIWHCFIVFTFGLLGFSLIINNSFSLIAFLHFVFSNFLSAVSTIRS